MISKAEWEETSDFHEQNSDTIIKKRNKGKWTYSVNIIKYLLAGIIARVIVHSTCIFIKEA